MQGKTISATYSAMFRRGWIAFWSVWILVGLGLAWFVMPWFGMMVMAVFGAMLALTLHRLANPAPVIRIGPEGFHDRRLGAVIPWAAITSFRRHQPGNRIILQIGVDDPGAYLGNAGVLKGPMLRINPAMGMPAIGSNLAGLDVPQAQLADAVEGWLAARA